MMDSFTKTESSVATSGSEQVDGAAFEAASDLRWVQDYRESGGRNFDFF